MEDTVRIYQGCHAETTISCSNRVRSIKIKFENHNVKDMEIELYGEDKSKRLECESVGGAELGTDVGDLLDQKIKYNNIR